MRIVMFRHNGQPLLGAEVAGRIVDLQAAYGLAEGDAVSPQLCGALLPPDTVSFLAAGEPALAAARRAVAFASQLADLEAAQTRAGRRVAYAPAEVVLAAPVPRPGKLICIGLNYRDHAEESGAAVPSEPVFFSKYATSVVGPGEPIVHPGPAVTRELDYEAELALVIGRRTRHVPVAEAWAYVAGYTVLNDISARDLQMGVGGQWVKGKALDTFAPMGPCLVTPDELADPQRLRLQLRLNGRTLQDSSTEQLIFSIPELIAFLSRLFTLEPGDVISTGTPSGVGFARKPPVFLQPGDVVEAEVEGIGVLRNPVVAAD